MIMEKMSFQLFLEDCEGFGCPDEPPRFFRAQTNLAFVDYTYIGLGT